MRRDKNNGINNISKLGHLTLSLIVSFEKVI